MKAVQIGLIVFCLYLAAVAGSDNAEARTVRATEMDSELWTKIAQSDPTGLIVEFRQGDELPVNLSSKGDLLETVQIGTSFVHVKRNLWLKLGPKESIQMSLDGVSYKPLSETISGTLTAGTDLPKPGTPVQAINLIVESHLR